MLSWARKNETGRLPQKPKAPLHPCPVLRLPSPGYQASIWAFQVYGDLRHDKIEILKKIFLSCYCSFPGPPLFIHYSAVIEYPLSAFPWACAGVPGVRGRVCVALAHASTCLPTASQSMGLGGGVRDELPSEQGERSPHNLPS